jgi:uncharacterized Zn finger protein
MRRELLALALKGIAGTAYFARGKTYNDQNRVQWLDENDEGVDARVRGTRDYTVQLWEEGGKTRYNCDCPIGQDGEFCKHCVAAALAWLGETEPQPARPGEAPPKRRSAIEDIRDYLASMEPDQLIDLIVNACRRDDRMREKLLLAARGRGDIHAAIKTWKEAFKRATTTRGFVDYGEMPYFVAGIRDVVNALDSWITDGRAAAVVELAEYAVSRVESAMEECDDSNGELGGLLARIAELHLDACRAASPDPAELAERLFEYELNGQWDTFSSTVELYAEVLGEPGLARYRQLAEAEWAKVPALRPGDDKNQTWHGNRYRITQIMETLARQTGDVEALVAVEARDLSSAWRFLQIAEIYRKAGQRDKALEWAERGLAAFPQRTDGRLREFLIEEYLHRGRGEEAATLAWAQFEEGPRLESFEKLKAAVQRAGGDWSDWRDRALKHLRQDIAREFAERNKTGYARMTAPDPSRLVEILLSEQEIEAARHEAGIGSCRDELWLRLADLRAKDHPEDSLAIYRRHVARLVEQTNTPAYEQAMVLIRKIEPLLRNRDGGAQQWSDYLAELRGKYKAKRNFMKLLSALP